MSLSKGVDKFFKDSKYEVKYGEVELSPIQYQDDAIRLTGSVEGARDGIRRFEELMGSKCLNVNIDKSIYMLAGKKSNVERIREQLKEKPLCYDGTPLKEKQTEKWLGDVIHVCGPRESTLETIKERKVRILTAIHEIIAIIEDTRLDKTGSLKFAIEVWQLAIIPALTNNCDGWNVRDKQVQKEVEEFQSRFLKGILAIPNSCPRSALYYESNLLRMKYRMYGKVLNLIKHIYHHEEENLSKQILTEQLKNGWHGLSKDAMAIAEELELKGLFDSHASKGQFKLRVKEACRRRNDEELEEEIKSYKKMKAMRDEVEKGNGYFYKESLSSARIIFRFRAELIEAKMNFKSKQEYRREGYLCDSCETEIDENTHVLFCPAFKELREGKDVNNDRELAEYLKEVLSIRMQLRLNR